MCVCVCLSYYIWRGEHQIDDYIELIMGLTQYSE